MGGIPIGLLCPINRVKSALVCDPPPNRQTSANVGALSRCFTRVKTPTATPRYFVVPLDSQVGGLPCSSLVQLAERRRRRSGSPAKAGSH
jgi:hypothetical protein